MKVEEKGHGKMNDARCGWENQPETSGMTHLPCKMHGANQRSRQLEFTCVYICR